MCACLHIFCVCWNVAISHLHYDVEWKNNEPENQPIGLTLKRYNFVAAVNHGMASALLFQWKKKTWLFQWSNWKKKPIEICVAQKHLVFFKNMSLQKKSWA